MISKALCFVIKPTRLFNVTKPPRCFRLVRWRLYRWWLVEARYESYVCNQRHPVMKMHKRAWRRGFIQSLFNYFPSLFCFSSSTFMLFFAAVLISFWASFYTKNLLVSKAVGMDDKLMFVLCRLQRQWNRQPTWNHSHRDTGNRGAERFAGSTSLDGRGDAD